MAVNIVYREGRQIKIDFTLKDARNIAIIMAVIMVFYRLQVKG